MKTPVRLNNPAQVFACLGLVSLAEALYPKTQVSGEFSYKSAADKRSEFRLTVEGGPQSVVAVLIKELLVTTPAILLPSEAYKNVTNEKSKKPLLGNATHRVRERNEVFPYRPRPKYLKLLPVELRASGAPLVVIDYPMDEPQITGRPSGRLWAPTSTSGTNFYDMVSGLLELASKSSPDGASVNSQETAAMRCFNLSDPFGSENYRMEKRALGFRLDPSWRPSTRRAGFSIHDTDTACAINPLTELLSAIGLSQARMPVFRKDRLLRSFHVPLANLPASQLRAAVSGVPFPVPTKRYLVTLEDLTGKGTYAIESVLSINSGDL